MPLNWNFDTSTNPRGKIRINTDYCCGLHIDGKHFGGYFIGRGSHCYTYMLDADYVLKFYFHCIGRCDLSETQSYQTPIDYRNATRIGTVPSFVVESTILPCKLSLLNQSATMMSCVMVKDEYNGMVFEDFKACETFENNMVLNRRATTNTYVVHIQIAPRAIGTLLKIKPHERERVKKILGRIRKGLAEMVTAGYYVMDSSPPNYLIFEGDRPMIGDIGCFCTREESVGVTFPMAGEYFPPPSQCYVVWGFFTLCYSFLVRSSNGNGFLQAITMEQLEKNKRLKGARKSVIDSKGSFATRLIGISKSMLLFIP